MGQSQTSGVGVNRWELQCAWVAASTPFKTEETQDGLQETQTHLIGNDCTVACQVTTGLAQPVQGCVVREGCCSCVCTVSSDEDAAAKVATFAKP